MKNLFIIAVVLSLLPFAGCRRNDVREFVIEMPSLTAADKPLVVAALAGYDGVRKDSYVFNFAKRTLTLKYDSMKVAKMNILQSIEAKGVKVVYPEVRGGYAGYLNEKSK